MRKLVIAVASVAVVAAACGGGEVGRENPSASPSPQASAVAEPTSRFPSYDEAELLGMSEPVDVRASGGVRLEGRLFGAGEVGVVLSHMGDGDQSQWMGLAGLLADEGYLVLTYNRRGSCPGGDLGCSMGDATEGWKDLSVLVDLLREEGAQRVVVGGASQGAMESLYAMSRGLDADGLIWVAGVDLYGGVPVTEQVEGLRVPKLFLSGEFDHQAASLLPELGQAGPPPSEVILLETGEHGTDILAFGDVEDADAFRQAVLDFLARV
jgi:pimeloyl-ACP methyl ester carboxylesterase